MIGVAAVEGEPKAAVEGCLHAFSVLMLENFMMVVDLRLGAMNEGWVDLLGTVFQVGGKPSRGRLIWFST